MKPPFKKTSIGAAIEQAEAGHCRLLNLSITNKPIPQKIGKSGPFKLSKVSGEYPYFSHLLNLIVQEKIRELPDFSDDAKIAVMSDFGGEHSGALFNTYSFLFIAYNKVGVFEQKIRGLRKKYGLLTPYSEFAYKKLKSGARSRALPEYLQLVDQFIHGAIITIAIDTQIETVFGAEKKQVQSVMIEQMKKECLGEWPSHVAEKAFRVTHIIAAFASLLTYENQRLLWYSDKDSINDDGRKRDSKHTQQIFNRVLDMYMTHRLDIIGFGKSFDEKSHLDDLLSVPDLAAGVVQDLLLQYETQADIPGGNEKATVMRWIATPAKYLSKITIQIRRTADGGIGYGTVEMTVNESQ